MRVVFWNISGNNSENILDLLYDFSIEKNLIYWFY